MTGSCVKPLIWHEGELRLLDQRLLPHTEHYLNVRTLEECSRAICEMVVRGAPLIGFTALWALVLWLQNHPAASLEEFRLAGKRLKSARPTAINLAYEIELALAEAVDFCATRDASGSGEVGKAEAVGDQPGRVVPDSYKFVETGMAGDQPGDATLAAGHVRAGLAQARDENSQAPASLIGFLPRLEAFSRRRMESLAAANRRMAQLTVSDLEYRYGERRLGVMTICNTGALACGCTGTALGVIEYLAQLKRLGRVFVSETRPYLQGSRLTSYELGKAQIEHEIVVEGAAAHLLGSGQVDAVFAGADRIAGNGDTANKIGTATLALVAKYYNIPFYIIAPLSSFHPELPSGKEIPVEIRDQEEILSWREQRIAPPGARAYNPAFDITASENITAIVCEKGVISPVTRENLQACLAL